MNEEQLKLAVDHILRARKITVIMGAGVSAAAGIPPFRGDGGIHKDKFGSSKIKDLFSASSLKHPRESNDHCKLIAHLAKKAVLAEPTKFHQMLAILDEKKKIRRIYTQNIDGLESRVGFDLDSISTTSAVCIPLHGSLSSLRCTHCRYKTPLELHFDELDSGRFPTCPRCQAIQIERKTKDRRETSQGLLRADIVLYDEPVDHEDEVIKLASFDCEGLSKDDVLLVAGTSLQIPGICEIFKQIGGSMRVAEGQVIHLDIKAPTSAIANRCTMGIQEDCQKFADEVLQGLSLKSEEKEADHIRVRRDLRPLWDW